MKFRDIINEYLKSVDYKQKMSELNKNIGIYYAKKFRYFSENFINNYQN